MLEGRYLQQHHNPNGASLAFSDIKFQSLLHREGISFFCSTNSPKAAHRQRLETIGLKLDPNPYSGGNEQRLCCEMVLLVFQLQPQLQQLCSTNGSFLKEGIVFMGWRCPPESLTPLPRVCEMYSCVSH